MIQNFSSRIPRICPLAECSAVEPGLGSGRIVRKGYFRRSSDGKVIPRFFCRDCRRTFSHASRSPCFGQKKRGLNEKIRRLLCSGVSQRRIALLLGISRTTVERKFLFLAERARVEHGKFLHSLARAGVLPARALQFDEMESFERSKCLPISIPLAVLPSSRKILGVGVASMPARGPLAELSRKKYGKRADERAREASLLLYSLVLKVVPNVEILTDQNPKYPAWIRRELPHAVHRTTKGRRGCIVGQGELKKIGFDPLFSLNHTAAMIRANVNRLFRRTWCTTKRKDRLLAHLLIYTHFHNEKLTASVAKDLAA